MEKEFEEFIVFRCKKAIHESGIFNNIEQEDEYINNNILVLVKCYKKGFMDSFALIENH